MARRKQVQTEEQGEPEMEISSMIDCCFLLLIYFLVATSLVSEKKFDMNLPASSNATSSSDNKPFNINVAENNSVMMEDDSGTATQMAPASQLTLRPGEPGYYEERNLADLAEYLIKLNPPDAPEEDKKPVILTAHPNAKHQRVMDVMAALSKAKITSVAVKMSTVGGAE